MKSRLYFSDLELTILRLEFANECLKINDILKITVV